MKDDAHLPKVLHFEIGGFTGPCHEVLWTDGQLLCRHAPGAYMWQEEPLRCNPSPEQWEQFWAAVNAAGVWNWARDYTNPDVLDGTQWLLKLTHDGGTVRCAGSNAFPGSEGPNFDRAIPFGRFLTALERLTGLAEIG